MTQTALPAPLPPDKLRPDAGPQPAPLPAAPAARPDGTLSIATAANGRRIPLLSGPEKAAVLVRLLLAEGAELPLATLPEAVQTALTEQMGRMRLIDRDTLAAVVAEFTETLEQVGLTFPDGIEGAMRALDGRLSAQASSRLKQMARTGGVPDPWMQVIEADTDTLSDLLARESPEVAAVALSRLPVSQAAELLGRMPGERARRVAYAISRTEGIAPRVVTRIGAALARQIEGRTDRAFATPPTARIGAILNSAPADLRDQVLDGLADADADFANGVRRAIFTFAHIPQRLAPRDVPKVLRDLAQDDLITALGGALAQPESDTSRAADFLLANMSQRLAQTLREEIDLRGTVKPKVAETAMSAVVASIRALADDGTITLITDDD